MHALFGSVMGLGIGLTIFGFVGLLLRRLASRIESHDRPAMYTEGRWWGVLRLADLLPISVVLMIVGVFGYALS